MKDQKQTNAERTAASRKKRLAAGLRVDLIITDKKVMAKLEKIAQLHGGRRQAIEAAILAL